jgi:hypothetical protein
MSEVKTTELEKSIEYIETAMRCLELYKANMIEFQVITDSYSFLASIRETLKKDLVSDEKAEQISE